MTMRYFESAQLAYHLTLFSAFSLSFDDFFLFPIVMIIMADRVSRINLSISGVWVLVRRVEKLILIILSFFHHNL
jgi:hypothetical protein